MNGVLFGVGVGPGEPELITLKAINCIRQSDVIAIPAKSIEKCVAYQIAAKAMIVALDDSFLKKEVLCCPIPMTMDRKIVDASYEEAALNIIDILKAGKNVAFLNLGDPTVYGTYMPVHEKIRNAGYDAHIVSGVTSFCSVAAKCEIPLAVRNEKIHIVPGMYDFSEVKNMDGNVVLMKSADRLRDNQKMLSELEEQGLIQTYAVSNCGMDDEVIWPSILGDDFVGACEEHKKSNSYFTTMIIKDGMKKQAEVDIDDGENNSKFVYKNQKKLRRGITTGTCATAAAYCATKLLVEGVVLDQVSLVTPSKETVSVDVIYKKESCSNQKKVFSVMKDSGDDPDVTNHAEIEVCVEVVSEIQDNWFCNEKDSIYLCGGTGVGRVTKEGLEQAVGYAAINKVPRSMIFDAVSEIVEANDYKEKLLVTINVPEGEALAKKTFNPMLGIEGGISILGTSGILEPMSEKAIVDTIETLIRQQSKMGKDVLLVTPGNYGQGYVSDYLGLPLTDSIKCSNFVGETIDLAVSYNMKDFLLVGNFGKLVKLASGIMNTHSKVADGRMETICTYAALCGATKEIIHELLSCINTDQALDVLDRYKIKDDVIAQILHQIEFHINRRSTENMRCAAFVFSEKYGFLGKTKYADEILKRLKQE